MKTILDALQELYRLPAVQAESIKVFDTGWRDATPLELYEANIKLQEMILEEEKKAKVPQSVTMRQARLALLESGLLDAVENAVAQDRSAQIDWEYATDIQRDFSTLTIMATQMGLSDEQVDNLFILAGSK